MSRPKYDQSHKQKPFRVFVSLLPNPEKYQRVATGSMRNIGLTGLRKLEHLLHQGKSKVLLLAS